MTLDDHLEKGYQDAEAMTEYRKRQITIEVISKPQQAQKQGNDFSGGFDNDFDSDLPFNQ